MKDQGWRAIGTQYRKASDILTSTLAVFFSAATQQWKGIERLVDPGTRGPRDRDSRTPRLAHMNRVRHRMADARNGGPPEWRTPGMAGRPRHR